MVTESLMTSSIPSEESQLLQPLKRSDIHGKDEDLTPLEEFYLAEIEQMVNADELTKL